MLLLFYTITRGRRRWQQWQRQQQQQQRHRQRYGDEEIHLFMHENRCYPISKLWNLVWPSTTAIAAHNSAKLNRCYIQNRLCDELIHLKWDSHEIQCRQTNNIGIVEIWMHVIHQTQSSSLHLSLSNGYFYYNEHHHHHHRIEHKGQTNKPTATPIPIWYTFRNGIHTSHDVLKTTKTLLIQCLFLASLYPPARIHIPTQNESEKLLWRWTNACRL